MTITSKFAGTSSAPNAHGDFLLKSCDLVFADTRHGLSDAVKTTLTAMTQYAGLNPDKVSSTFNEYVAKISESHTTIHTTRVAKPSNGFGS